VMVAAPLRGAARSSPDPARERPAESPSQRGRAGNPDHRRTARAGGRVSRRRCQFAATCPTSDNRRWSWPTCAATTGPMHIGTRWLVSHRRRKPRHCRSTLAGCSGDRLHRAVRTPTSPASRRGGLGGQLSPRLNAARYSAFSWAR
jgi:hypothetical protein